MSACDPSGHERDSGEPIGEKASSKREHVPLDIFALALDRDGYCRPDFTRTRDGGSRKLIFVLASRDSLRFLSTCSGALQ
jgi:hypothetical protein